MLCGGATAAANPTYIPNDTEREPLRFVEFCRAMSIDNIIHNHDFLCQKSQSITLLESPKEHVLIAFTRLESVKESFTLH